MPFFASFENIDQLGALFLALLLLPVAALLSLVALILAFWPRTQFASMWCAVACMVTSMPLGWIVASLFNKGGFGLLQAAFFLAPLVVAVAVCLLDFLLLRLDKKLDPALGQRQQGQGQTVETPPH